MTHLMWDHPMMPLNLVNHYIILRTTLNLFHKCQTIDSKHLQCKEASSHTKAAIQCNDLTCMVHWLGHLKYQFCSWQIFSKVRRVGSCIAILGVIFTTWILIPHIIGAPGSPSQIEWNSFLMRWGLLGMTMNPGHHLLSHGFMYSSMHLSQDGV